MHVRTALRFDHSEGSKEFGRFSGLTLNLPKNQAQVQLSGVPVVWDGRTNFDLLNLPQIFRSRRRASCGGRIRTCDIASISCLNFL